MKLSAYWFNLGALLLLVSSTAAQTTAADQSSPQSTEQQLNVNWLYGAYVPKDAPLESLTRQERFKLYLRQTFTTPGIYVKTLLFSMETK